MAAPTITGTPVSTSGFIGAGPITISSYSTHPSGDDIFVFVGHTYNAAAGTATGVTWNGVSMTKVDEQQHASADVNGSLWRIAASTNTTGDIVVTLPGSSDFIGTVGVFSANGVGSIGTMVKNTFSFAGTAGVTTTVTDGTTDSLILGMSVCRRNGTNTTLAAFTVTSGGTDIVNTGSSTAGQNYDRTCVFTEAGAASVVLDLTYAFDSDRIVMMGLALNGGGGGSSFFRPYFITG